MKKRKTKQIRKLTKHYHRKTIIVVKKLLKRKIFGFTIVELLLVIAIIAILATITLVSYPAILRMTNVAVIKNKLGDISKQLKLFQVENSTYPTTTDCEKPDSDSNMCIKHGAGETINFITNTNNDQDFYVTVEKNGYRYNIDQDGYISPGVAPTLSSSADNYVTYNGVGNTWEDINTNTIQNGGIFGFEDENDFISSKYLTNPGSENITVAMWIRPGSINGVYEVMVLGQWGTEHWPDWSIGQNGQSLKFNLTDASLAEYQCAGGQFENGEWHYVVGVWDDNSMSTYIDGIQVVSCTGSDALDAGNGNHPIGKYGDSPYYFNGLLGDIGVYDEALTASEIQESFDLNKTRYNLE